MNNGLELASNVFDFEAIKRKKELNTIEKNFKNYLSSLKSDQLEHEANYFMNKGEFSKEDTLKSALLMDELAKRMSSNRLKERVQVFSYNLKNYEL